MRQLPLKLEAIIQTGLLVLVALMPFHAFLSVWLGTTFGGRDIIQAWKEVLLLLLAGAAIALVIRERHRLSRLNQDWVKAAAAFAGIALLVTLVAAPGITAAAFGIKTDLEFLLAAVIAALVATGPFLRRLGTVIIAAAAIVAGFDLLQIFVLPPDFLTNFGYGPDTVVPFQHLSAGSSSLRFPATLGGPNQLGTYLILPLALVTARFVRERRWWQPVLFLALTISLVWTFSRSAWIGAVVAVSLTLLVTLPRRIRRPATFALAGLLIIGLASLPFLTKAGGEWQYLILHSSTDSYHANVNDSDSLHAKSLSEGTSALLSAPLGHGLGTAGPSTFHTGALNIVENYYLQVGYETGVAGLIAFVTVIVLIVRTLWRNRRRPLAIPATAAVIGVSLVGLVLPSWVDSTTALVTWITAGAAAGASDV